MQRVFKGLAIAVGVVIVLLVVLAVVVHAMFDGPALKARIEHEVQARTGRTLTIEGDLGLSLFPTLGVTLGQTTLSEHGTKTPAAHVDAARLSVALMPLLSKQVKVDRVVLDGLTATIVRNRDGSTNFDDLKGKPDASAPASKSGAPASPLPDIDIAGIEITRSAVTVRDLAKGSELALRDIALKTGRIANGVQTPIDAHLHVDGKQPAMALDVRAKGAVLVDAAAHHYALDGLDAGVKGTLGPRTVDVSVVAPQLSIDTRSTSAREVKLAFKLGGANALDGTLTASQFSGSDQDLKTQIALRLDLADPSAPSKKRTVSLDGPMHANLEAQTVGGAFEARIDDTPAKLRLDVAHFDKPHIDFDLDAQAIDLDKLLPAGAKDGGTKDGGTKDGGTKGGGTAGGSTAGPEADAPIDLSPLKSLDLDGKVRVGKFAVHGIDASQVSMTIAAHGGRARIAPMHLALYGGTADGSVSADANSDRVAIAQKLVNVNVGDLLRAASKVDKLEGKGAVSLDVTGAGPTVGAIRKSLSGTASMRVVDGTLKGFDYAKRLRAFQDNVKSIGALGGGVKNETTAASNDERTDFSELSVSFQIANGVATSKDLDLKAPLVRLGGAGAIDLGRESIDYLVEAHLVSTLTGQGGKTPQQTGVSLDVPVRVVGPFAKPNYEVQWASAAGSVLQNVLRSRGQSLNLPGLLNPNAAPAPPGTTPPASPQNDPGKALRDQLKGLLGR